MPVPLMLVDDDTEYVSRFADWIRLHPEAGFLLVPDADAGLPALHGGRPAWPEPVRLIAGAAWERTQDPCHKRRVLLEDGFRVEAEGCLRIAKYQSMPDLTAMLRRGSEARGWMPASAPLSVSVDVRVVIHLAGPAHLQPVAPVLAAWRAKTRDTLLLDLDPVQATRPWFSPRCGDGLSRLAYEAGSENPFDTPALERCLGRDGSTGVRCLRPPVLPEDAAGFDPEAVRRVVSAASGAGIASVVLDAGTGLHARNLSLAGIAGSLYLTATADPFGLRLLEEAAGLLLRAGLQASWSGGGPGLAVHRFSIPSGTEPESHAWGGAVRPVGREGDSLPPPIRLPSPFPRGWPSDPWDLDESFVTALMRAPGCEGGHSGQEVT